jgi:hypothetical protein
MLIAAPVTGPTSSGIANAMTITVDSCSPIVIKAARFNPPAVTNQI